MNKSENKPRLVTKVSAIETLLTLEIGKPCVIPTRKLNTGTVRTAASRLDKAKKARFLVSTKGLINETEVTRLM
jgi:hypothetical protein